MIGQLNAQTRPSWLDPQLYPFGSDYLEIAGCDIHYINEGDGPTLLLLHSNGMWSFTYRHLIRAMRDRFRCIALDFPGFGLSSAPREFHHSLSNYSRLLDEFVHKLKLRDIVLLAHDAGGHIGLGTVARHPAWFRGVILLDTFCFPVNKDRFLSGMLRLVSSKFPGVVLVDYLNMMITQIPNHGMKLRTLSHAEMAALCGPFVQRSRRKVMRDLFASVLDEPEYLAWLQRQLQQLDVPALLLPAGESGAVARLLPGLESTFARHETRILQGAGHFSQEDAPDQIVQAITSWSVLRERTSDVAS